MLDGFVPFPPEFVARYRARGYWQDQSLAQEFAAMFERHAARTLLVDGDHSFTYAEVDRLSDNLASAIGDVLGRAGGHTGVLRVLRILLHGR